MAEKHAHLHSGKDDHHKQAADLPPVRIALVTVSDSRSADTDVTGQYLKEQIDKSGHTFAGYHIVRDEPQEINQLLENLAGSEAQVILFNGGTGIAKRDSTYDVLSAKLEKVLPGFGELFRVLSYQQVGAAAMFSRATAGVYQGKVIISTPGSPAAVQLAWEKLILPELHHLVFEMSK